MNKKSNPITKADASRIQSEIAKSGVDTGLARRLQSAADKRNNK